MNAKMIVALCALFAGSSAWSEELSGVGMKLVSEQGNAMPLIKWVSPAQKGGIKAGTYLVSVNGTNMVGKPLGEAAALLRGEPGAKVTVQTFDAVTGKTNKLTVTRIPIEIKQEEPPTRPGRAR